MKAAAILLVFFLLATKAFAQVVTDTVVLRDVQVIESKREQTLVRESALRIAPFKNKSLGDLLAAAGGVNVRQYSPGGVATVALRGYTPQQVSVKWNGVDITNPMLGQTDLSLLPVLFFDNATLETEPKISDNAPAGSINLTETFSPRETNVSSYNAWSSLQNFTNSLQMKAGNAHWQTSLRLLSERNENKFVYRNLAYAHDTLVEQTHARTTGKGISGSVGFQKDKHSFRAGAYAYDADREIPPTMLQAAGKDKQHDRTGVGFFRYQRRAKSTVTADVSATSHRIDFYDGLVDVNYDSRSTVLRSSVLVERRIALVDVDFGLQSAWFDATVLPDVYTRSEFQHSVQLGASKEIRPLRTTIGITAMQRFRETDELPFNYSAFVLFTPVQPIDIKFTHARLSRFASLNDRYWKPGGNPALKSELASRNNLQVNYKSSFLTRMYMELSCDAHYDRVDNWIQWVPAGVVWSPKNVKSVLLYGLSPQLKVRRYSSKMSVTTALRYTFTKAVTRESFALNDASVGKQLTYVPLHAFHSDCAVATKRFSFFIFYNFSGVRYVASDHSEQLNPYYTVDAGFAYVVPLKSWSFEATAKCENITNTDYQSIAWRPMPRRVISLSINVQYQTPNKTHEPESTP